MANFAIFKNRVVNTCPVFQLPSACLSYRKGKPWHEACEKATSTPNYYIASINSRRVNPQEVADVTVTDRGSNLVAAFRMEYEHQNFSLEVSKGSLNQKGHTAQINTAEDLLEEILWILSAGPLTTQKS